MYRSAPVSPMNSSFNEVERPRVLTQTTEAPPNAVKAEELSIYFGKNCLLVDTELKIAEHNQLIESCQSSGGSKMVRSGLCYGLVGPNGSGKSTLLTLMADGSLPLPHTWDTVIVDQHLPKASQNSPVEEVLDADVRRVELLKNISALETKMVTCDVDAFSKLSDRMQQLQSELDRWEAERVEITKILVGLGFRHSAQAASSVPALDTPVCELSGGWQMKVQLAKALWLKPRLLLLDEPTNHLDFRALLWLEDQLHEYPHTLVVVSHDMRFLHDACSEILWLNNRKVESMPRDMVSQEDLARMQRRKPLNFKFAAAEGAEDHGISFHGMSFKYNNAKGPLLCIPGDVRFNGSSRSVVLGKNGSGKSTFMKLCAGSLEPTAGCVDRTHTCKIGHYSQDTNQFDENGGDESAAAFVARTCNDVLRIRAGLSEHRCGGRLAEERRLIEHARGVLSQFGLEGDAAVNVPTHRLSGGQKACVKFAALSLYPAHILLLDEPTNHLDAEACRALARGLKDFKGGVVVVSHDDNLIYELIECNFSTAELLVCQGGSVRREREFGALRLRNLKKQVREAEEIEREKTIPRKRNLVRPPRVQVVQTNANNAKSFDPPTPPGFSRVSSKVQTHPVLNDRSSPDHRAELAKCNFSRDENNQELAQSCQKPSVESRRVKVLLKKLREIKVLKGCDRALLDAAALEKISNELGFEQELFQLQHGIRLTPVEEMHSDQAENLSVNPSLEAERTGKAVDSQPLVEVMCEKDVQVPHEEVKSSNSEVPSTWMDPAEREELIASADVPESWMDLDLAENEESAVSPHGAVEIVSVQLDTDKPFAGKSGHSRQRKNMINLNKAVVKWRKRVELGTLAHETMLERIRASPAAVHLRFIHKDGFEEEKFVQEVLRRVGVGESSLVRPALLGGA